MPKLILMLEGNVVREVALTKVQTKLGRRPFNDVVLDNLAVSGEHAVLTLQDGQVQLEDLGSTNGTFVNGKAVKSQRLLHGDLLDLGKFKIRFDNPESGDNFDKTMVMQAHAPAAAASEALRASIKVLSGPAAGRELPLSKAVTTMGKPGIVVAAITRRENHFDIRHVEGLESSTLNAAPLGLLPQRLKHGDEIVLAGTKMQFLELADAAGESAATAH